MHHPTSDAVGYIILVQRLDGYVLQDLSEVHSAIKIYNNIEYTAAWVRSFRVGANFARLHSIT
jgi:hypothetical protein